MEGCRDRLKEDNTEFPDLDMKLVKVSVREVCEYDRHFFFSSVIILYRGTQIQIPLLKKKKILCIINFIPL